jgi:hypothetical protein
MAFVSKLAVVAMLLAGNKVNAVGVVQSEIIRQLRSPKHRGEELVYVYDKRGLYIKKSKHHRNKLPREQNLIDLHDDFTTEQLVNDALNMDFNVDNYMKSDPNYGFVDFGDNLVDDLRIDKKILEYSEMDKQTVAEIESQKKESKTKVDAPAP